MQDFSKVRQRKQRKVVTIGGGTGQSVLLEGLKKYPIRLTAIVSMADDGGATGVLRDELGVLPPGDIRMCLIALSNAPEKLRTLFQYRFDNGVMAGHTLGNMFLSALEKTSTNFSEAIKTAGEVLQVYGRVVPVSESDMRLMVTLKDGTVLRGEHYLNDNEEVRTKGVDHIALENKAVATTAATDAILEADCVVIGPGGLYDSLLPPLMVEGIAEALTKSSAHVIYVGNLTNKKGQTEGFSLHDYVDIVASQIGSDRIQSVIVRDAEPDTALLKRYEAQEGDDLLVKCPENQDVSYTIVRADVIAGTPPEQNTADAIAKSRSLIRHDSDKLAQAVMDIVSR